MRSEQEIVETRTLPRRLIEAAQAESDCQAPAQVSVTAVTAVSSQGFQGSG